MATGSAADQTLRSKRCGRAGSRPATADPIGERVDEPHRDLLGDPPLPDDNDEWRDLPDGRAARRRDSAMNSIFEHVPFYPLVFALFWGAAVVFALAMARHLRVFAAARASGPSPFENIPARLIGLVQYAFLQTKMFKDARAAILHLGIFWGFILLTVGTANIVTGGLIQAVLSRPVRRHPLGARARDAERRRGPGAARRHLWAFERRFISRPPRLTYNVDALLILGMIGGARRRPSCSPRSSRSPRFGEQPGAFIANAPRAAPRRRAAASARPRSRPASRSSGGLHMALVAAFLVYLPFSKHLHIVTSFFNIYFRKLAPRGELPAMDLEAEDATFGLRTLADLGWNDLLDGFTCTECGRCQQACPAWNTGKPLNPKHFIMGIRDMSVEAEHGLPLIPNSPSAAGFGLDRFDPAGPAAPRRSSTTRSRTTRSGTA